MLHATDKSESAPGPAVTGPGCRVGKVGNEKDPFLYPSRQNRIDGLIGKQSVVESLGLSRRDNDDFESAQIRGVELVGVDRAPVLVLSDKFGGVGASSVLTCCCSPGNHVLDQQVRLATDAVRVR